MDIKAGDLSDPRTIALLTEHVDEMRSISPPGSTHVLDPDGLRNPRITFWSVWDGEVLAGCGALKRLDDEHAEIKSMRTARSRQRSGVASRLLTHLIAEARGAGYRRLSLETGSAGFFAPALALYAKHGFAPCAPFGDYKDDPNSAFMTRLV